MHQAPRIILVASILTLVSCGQDRAPDASDRLHQELSDSLGLISKEADFNGFGVALVDSTGVLYANGFGMADVARKTPYTANTRQPIASISKTFIGLAVMKAQELGLLHLDDPVAKHLPFAVVNPQHPNTAITVRHLVTHTSSITDDREYLFRAWILRDTEDLARNLALDIGACRFSAPNTAVSMEEFLRRYLAKEGVWYSDSAFAATEPGSRFAYSNIGATLAALDRVAGRTEVGDLQSRLPDHELKFVPIERHTRANKYVLSGQSDPHVGCRILIAHPFVDELRVGQIEGRTESDDLQELTGRLGRYINQAQHGDGDQQIVMQ